MTFHDFWLSVYFLANTTHLSPRSIQLYNGDCVDTKGEVFNLVRRVPEGATADAQLNIVTPFGNGRWGKAVVSAYGYLQKLEREGRIEFVESLGHYVSKEMK